MCEKCNCKTSENIYQAELEVYEAIKAGKKDNIEYSLKDLCGSLESLESLNDKISNSPSVSEPYGSSIFIFESLEELLNTLPDKLYNISYRINEIINKINAKLF